MSTLDRKKLRQLILKEIQKMEEDSLRVMHDDPGRQSYVASKGHHCHECGYGMKEGESTCEQCGSGMKEDHHHMHEGSCDASSNYKHDDDVKIGNHKHYKGSYMAKSQMYKVAKYAEKLYHMIPDGHNLEDWMRTKLAQIADDIGEVYHALDHDIYEGDV